jgi:protein phosphatase
MTANVLHISVGHATDRGLRREQNEDSLLARIPVFAVADGMGGHVAGEVASTLCVEALGDNPGLAAGCVITATEVQRALDDADTRIRVATDGRAGTTVVGAVLVSQEEMPFWLFFNVGDSRAYRLVNGALGQITVDHSEVQELMDQGRITAQEALVHPRRHVVTRALGAGEQIGADFWLLPVTPGERILICSDGLTTELADDDIRSILNRCPQAQDACGELVDAALRSGGRDNVTVIVLDPTMIAPAGVSEGNPDSAAVGS